MKNRKIFYALFYALSFTFYLNANAQYITLRPEANLVGSVTDGVQGIPGVVVSDGYTVTTTDKDGIYQMKRNKDAKFVFISVPSDYKLPTEGSIPAFYKSINRDLKIVYANFQLAKCNVDNDFVLIGMADTQPSKDWELERFRNETVRDIISLKNDYPKSTSFIGVVVGDLVWDAPRLYPGYTDAINEIPFPVLQVIGNHDHDEKVTDNDIKASHNFEKYFGPVYYSYNKGKCHLVVLDDIVYSNRKSYEKQITAEQIAWLKQDLSHVGKDKLIIISAHIPTKFRHFEVSNNKELYDLLEGYQAIIISGHTHFGDITYIRDNITEYTLNAVFGSGWTGDIGENGAPNGYAVFEISGNKLKNQYFKGTGSEASYQIKLYPPKAWDSKKKSIIANIWNWNKNWTVQVYEDDKLYGNMVQYTDYDPFAYEYMFGPDKPKHRPNTEPKQTDRLFYYTPKNKNGVVKVVAKDEFGNTFVSEINLKDYKH